MYCLKNTDNVEIEKKMNQTRAKLCILVNLIYWVIYLFSNYNNTVDGTLYFETTFSLQ